MKNTLTTQSPIIHIEPAAGGVNLFVPIEPGVLANRSYQELLIRAHDALLSYLAMTTTEQLPVIA
jgi:hypothetical protein